MITNPKDFYSLMADAGITSASSFQSYIKDVLSATENQNLKIDGFNWRDMQISFDYTQLIVESKLSVMSSYVDLDSPAAPIGSGGIELKGGTIPRLKTLHSMDESEYRKYFEMRASLAQLGLPVENAAMNKLFEITSEAQKMHELSVTYQRDQMVSNGALVLTDKNNPRGLQNLTFSANIPDANKTTLTGTAKWFTTADGTTEGSASDPMANLVALVKAIKKKYVTGFSIECDRETLEKTLEHSKVKIAIGRYMYPLIEAGTDGDTQAMNAIVYSTYEAKKAALEAMIGAKIIASETIVAIEKLNATTKKLERIPIRSFNPNVFVARPDGNIGDIFPVFPLTPDSNGVYAKSMQNRMLWTYDYDTRKKIQTWETELTCLAVPNKVYEMFYLTIA